MPIAFLTKEQSNQYGCFQEIQTRPSLPAIFIWIMLTFHLSIHIVEILIV